jgi:hypothetical protein
VTFLGDYPVPHIQIILRIYKNPTEILMGFDIDCCCGMYLISTCALVIGLVLISMALQWGSMVQRF